MITQLIIDFFSHVIAQLLHLVPPAPEQFSQLITWLSDAAIWLASNIGVLAPIVPFDVLNVIISVWLALVAFYVAMLGARFIIWAAKW